MKRNVHFAAIALASAMLSCFGARAQTPAPGGVATGLTQWYRADEGIVSGGDGTNVTSWTDFAGGTVSAQIGTAPRPFFKTGATNYFNFNPGVNFTAIQQMLGNIATQTLSNTSFDIFTLTKEGMTGTRFFNIGMENTTMNGANWDQPGLYADGSIGSRNNTGGGSVNTNPGNIDFSTSIPSIMYHTFTNTTISKGVNGNTQGSVLNVPARGLSVGGHIFGANGGTNPPGGDDWGFTGHIGEVIIYGNGNLSATDRNKVDSYLALKYGITLPASVNYLNSDGTIVWNPTTNSAYHNNVAGIIHDQASALNQKQSISVNAGKQLIISTTGLANTNVANVTSLSDGQSLIWGDNGLTKAPAVAFPGAGTNFRFAAIWKAQNVGSVGTVRVTWPAGLTNLKLIQSADETIDGSDVSTDMSANTQVVNGVSYNYADVTLADGAFFTFAAYVQAPGGVAANLLMWYKANDGVATAGAKNIWKDMSVNGRDVVQDNNAANQPNLVTSATYTADSKNYSFNFNPFYYFDGSNDFFHRDNDTYFPATTSPGSTYGVMFNSSAGGWRTAYGWGDDDPNLVRGDNNYYVARDNGVTINENVGLNAMPVHLAGMSWKGSGAANNGMYLNVNGQVYSSTNTNVGQINDADNFAIGSEGFALNGNGNEVYQGGISEVFAYSDDHQNSAGDEKQRINSYLAIKYGITLSNDAGTGTADYLSSKSAIVWSASGNAGYNNNIAGLAKDDNSALHQKQSSSSNAGQQVIIGTNGLGNTNEANTADLTDGQFFVWGDNGLDKSPTVALTGVSGLNYRFAAIWKVQNTNAVAAVRVAWPAGIPGLHLIQSTDATFEDSDLKTDMSSNTISINGASYNYADVTINNGLYFTFAANLIGPGGVGGAVVWLRADSGTNTTTDGSDVSSWLNIGSSGGTAGQLQSYTLPTFKNAVHNFNPSIIDQTTNANGALVLPNVFPAMTQHPLSTFVLQSQADVAQERTMVSYSNETYVYDRPWFPGYQSRLRFWWQDSYEGTPTLPNGLTRKDNIPSINAYYMPQYTTNPHTTTLSMNGATTTQSGNVNPAATLGNYLLINSDGGANNNSGGNISEVISYGRDLSPTEQQQVNTYLAIKYGISLLASDGLAVTDYLNSSAGKVWDIAANTGYNNNVAGIARDNNGGLYQKQSSSVNSGQQVLIGTTGLAATNASNAGAIGDGQFLLWGDNGLSKAPGIYNAGLGNGVNVLFKAIWKAQNTGDLGTVRVAWPAGLNNLTLVQSGDQTFDGSDTFTPMSANSQNINGVTYNYADVTLSNGQYFTFATLVAHAPGGVFAGLSLWYRADIDAANTGDATDVTSWTDYASGVVSAQLGAAVLPKFKTGASDYFNFNPGINFTSASQTLGNITVPTVSAQEYDIFTLTKEGLVPGGNGRIFSGLVNNTDVAGSINYWDGIGILADNRIERMNTAYNFRYLANPGNINWSSNSPSIMYNTFTNTTVAKGLNGAANGATASHTAIGTLTGGHAIGSTQFSSNGSDNAGFTGNIGEVVVYGGNNITAAERNKVDSYLAVKYGVTLSNTNNYITSAGDTVWYAASSTAFYNNVAGLGRDNVSALHQKQSRSQHTNSNNQVTIGLGQIAATNAANPGSIADGQFLIWGDNGQTQVMTNNTNHYFGFTYNAEAGVDNGRRMTRTWKVQNTGMGQEVLIRFPQASVGNTTFPNEGCAKFVLVVADDQGFTDNDYVLPLTLNGTDYEVMHTFPAGVSYFTFGKVNEWAPGVVQLPAAVTSAPDFSACASNSWYYAKQTASTDKYLGIKGMTTAQLNNLDVVIDPVGTEFNGTIHTKLMPRVATVTDAATGTYTGVKVRVYFSQSELNATIVGGAMKSAWFKFEGDAAAVRSDIDADGLMRPDKATELVPSGSGTEDGISYVEFDNVTTFSSFVYVSTTAESALPVTLTYFKAAKEGAVANLTWATTEEVNNKGFEIQRSSDARKWEAISFVGNKTEGGNSKGLLTYDFQDVSPLAGANYYRLKQIDQDDSYAYSSAVVLHFEGSKNAMLVYPNPVVNGKLSLDLPQTGSYKLSVYNVAGVEVLSANQSGNTVDVHNLRAGLYLLRVVYPNGNTHSKPFVIK